MPCARINGLRRGVGCKTHCCYTGCIRKMSHRCPCWQGGRLVGMDDVDAAVEEHKEQGRMTKWWNGVTSSKSGQAFSNNRAVKALTYVSILQNFLCGFGVEPGRLDQCCENRKVIYKGLTSCVMSLCTQDFPHTSRHPYHTGEISGSWFH